MNQVVITECTYCHEIKECTWEVDPYIHELYDEIEEGYWCDECWDKRWEDI